MGTFPRRKGHGGRVAGVSYPRPNPSPKQIRHSRQAGWKDGRWASMKAVEAFYLAKIYRENPGLEEYLDERCEQVATSARAARAANGFRAVVDHLRAVGGEGNTRLAAIAESLLEQIGRDSVTPDQAAAAFVEELVGYRGGVGRLAALREAFVRGASPSVLGLRPNGKVERLRR